MSAKSPEVVDGMIDDSLLDILIILLVVMLSTGYVYVQQLQQGAAPQPANARMAPSTAAALASSPARAAIATTGLSDRQLRLHFTLPMRNGARTVTLSAESLLTTDNDEALNWTHPNVPTLLADLLHVADVYLLCTVKDAKQTQQIREFVTTHPDLKSSDGGFKPHKILFCTTAIGKIAFVRQIEPHVHVEVDAAVVRDLEKHVPRIVHLPSSPEEAVTSSIPNVIHVGDSFAGYFSLLSSKERLQWVC